MTKSILSLFVVALTASLSISAEAQITQIFGCTNTVLTARFGEIYCGSFPTGIQLKDWTANGTLHVQNFGEVRAGTSSFSIGTLDTTNSGPLRTDSFGYIRIGNAPWDVDLTPIVK